MEKKDNISFSDIVAKELFGIFRKAVDMFKDDSEKKKELKNGFCVWKEVDSKYRWLAVYSNKFRDRDNPSEIISDASHRRFDEMLDRKEAPMPELRHWHIPGTEYGVADWHTYDPESGFAIASGYIYPGHEKEAEALMAMDDVAVSHGMYEHKIKRAPDDPTVIIEHETFEISDLPRGAAANPLTTFNIVKKELDMAIPDKKKEYLRHVGLTDETISDIENKLKEVSAMVTEAGIESKDITEVQHVEQSDMTQEKPQDIESVSDLPKQDQDVKTEEEQEQNPEKSVSDNTTDDNSKALKELAVMIATVVKEMIAPLEKSITEIKEDMEKSKEKEKLDFTPAASIAAMVARQMTATNSKETRVRQNSDLDEMKPKETQKDDDEFGLHSIISNIISR
ncbi:MAG: hypothetical protein HPY87_08950 [Fervidobacterium sp.]|uniref:hypothetical protein n=1 Tax=Fervidobacterium sp. TaxID=1871331 RepID=UPI0025C48A74|nr:hypothetical protein [Fervidobacterium sp.]NPU89988.1 hypothetical protein [Fervidobacterium sp.]